MMGRDELWRAVPWVSNCGPILAPMRSYAFDTDTAVSANDDGTFHAHIHSRWTIADVPNGGYLMAVMLRAVQHMSTHPDPLTMTAHFLSPTSAGPAGLQVEIAKPGRSTSTAMVSLHQEGRERVRALVTLGNLEARQGPTHELLAPPALEGPFETRRSRLMQEFPKNFDFEIPASVAGAVVGKASGQPEMGGRMRFSDGRPPDLLALPVIADGFPPVAFNLGYEAWTPTVELTIHFWNHPSPGPITAWITSGIFQGGFHDETATLWDSTGTLVARSRQLALVL